MVCCSSRVVEGRTGVRVMLEVFCFNVSLMYLLCGSFLCFVDCALLWVELSYWV